MEAAIKPFLIWKDQIMTIEEKARIRNLNADTALKLAQIRTERLKVATAVVIAVAAVVSAIVTLIKAL